MLALNQAHSRQWGYKGEKKPHPCPEEGPLCLEDYSGQPALFPAQLPTSWHSPLVLSVPGAQVRLTLLPAQDQAPASSWAHERQTQASLALLGERIS